MIMDLIFLLLLVTLGFAIFKYYKTSLTILSFAIIIFFMTGNGFISKLLLKNLESFNVTTAQQPVWQQSNAIVILGGGTTKVGETTDIIPSMLSYSRIYQGARLYYLCKKTGFKCVIIVSGGDVTHTGTSEAVVYKSALMQLNISDSDIKIEPQSKNTFQNAQFIRDILKKEKFEQVYLVTSALHLKRALLYFSYFGIDAKPAPSDYVKPKKTIAPSSYNFAITDFALHEYTGIMQFHLYNFLGWNTK